MRNRTTLACASLVAVLAIVSLMAAAGRMSHSVWLDESHTHLISRQSTLGEVTSAAMNVRPYPPLFFFVVHYSLLWRDDEIGLRLPSAVFGALTLAAVFLLGAELAGPVTGAIAALLLFLTPGSFRYFVDGNAYTLLMLSSALSTFFLLRAARSDSWRDWSLYAICAAVGLGTHTLFVFYLGAQFLAGIWLKARAGGRTLRSYRRLVTVGGLLLGAVTLWTAFYLGAGGYSAQARPSRLFDTGTLVSMAGMYAGPQSFGGMPQLLMWGAILPAGLAALYRDSRDRFWAVVLLTAVPVAAITVLSKMTLPYVAYRYGLGIFPLVCVAAACSVQLRVGQLPVKRGAAVVMAAYCIAGAAFLATAGPDTFGYQDWRGAVAYLARHSRADEAIIVEDELDYVAFTYYWKGPPPVRAGGGSPDEVTAQIVRTLETHAATSDRAWLVSGHLARENPLLAQFTESRQAGRAERLEALGQMLREHGLHACPPAEFQRATVLEIRRTPCREAD